MALDLSKFIAGKFDELKLEDDVELNGQIAKRLDRLYALSDEIRGAGSDTARRYALVHPGIMLRFFENAEPAFDWAGSKGLNRDQIEKLPRDSNYYRNVFELARVRARNASDTPEEYSESLLKFLDTFVATMEADLKTAQDEVTGVEDVINALEVLETSDLPPPLQIVHGLADDDATLLSVISTKI